MILAAASPRWQTTIADLALILFLLAASALDHASPAPPTSVMAPGIALTLWRDEPGALPLAEWLAEQAPDSAHRLAITVTYAPGGLARSLERVGQLQAQAGAAAENARVSFRPGLRDTILVRLGQDAPAAATGPDIAS